MIKKYIQKPQPVRITLRDKIKAAYIKECKYKKCG